MTASSARLGSCNRRPPPIATTKPLLKPKQTHLADPNQNHKPPPPTHTKTHEPLLSHSTTLPLKDHKNQHRSTPKLTKTAYPHHHTVAKTTIERRKERENKERFESGKDEGVGESNEKKNAAYIMEYGLIFFHGLKNRPKLLSKLGNVSQCVCTYYPGPTHCEHACLLHRKCSK